MAKVEVITSMQSILFAVKGSGVTTSSKVLPPKTPRVAAQPQKPPPPPRTSRIPQKIGQRIDIKT